MVSRNILLFRIIVLLWVLCAVACEHQKRDVHRIVIQERIPRNHKRGHNHQGHSHIHNKGHANHGHKSKNKKSKRPQKNQESDSSSYEDSGSYSRENSYEDIFYGRQVQKPHRPETKPSHHRPSYPTNLKIEESRPHQYKGKFKPNSDNEWVPLNTEQILQYSQESYRSTDRKNRKENKTKSRKQNSKNKKPLHVPGHTSSYSPLHFDAPTLYPPLSIFPDTFSEINGKVLELNQSPILATFEQPAHDFTNSKDGSDQLRNHRTSYDVREADESDIGTFILVPDDKTKDNVDEHNHKHDSKATHVKKTTTNRGSVTFSGTTDI